MYSQTLWRVATVSCTANPPTCHPLVAQRAHGECQPRQRARLARKQPVAELAGLSGRHAITLKHTYRVVCKPVSWCFDQSVAWQHMQTHHQPNPTHVTDQAAVTVAPRCGTPCVQCSAQYASDWNTHVWYQSAVRTHLSGACHEHNLFPCKINSIRMVCHILQHRPAMACPRARHGLGSVVELMC
jgi:hypothetical protein